MHPLATAEHSTTITCTSHKLLSATKSTDKFSFRFSKSVKLLSEKFFITQICCQQSLCERGNEINDQSGIPYSWFKVPHSNIFLIANKMLLLTIKLFFLNHVMYLQYLFELLL